MTRRSFIPIVLAALVLMGPAAQPGLAVASTSQQAADLGVAFIAGQQRSDGGFGTAEDGFPGFETPDAVLAIAEEAQTGTTWSTAQAAAAVEAIKNNGRSGLDYLGDLADGDIAGAPPLGAGQAAKLIVVATAVGENVNAFDPDGQGDAVDLVAVMDAGRSGGSFGTFNATLTAAIAHVLIGRTVPAQTAALIEAAQQDNGGWNFAGDPALDDDDPDTTGLALQALVAAGRGSLSRSVRLGVAALARMQNTDGGHPSPFSDGQVDPNSTALAILGLTAAGHDVTSLCFKGTQLPGRPGRQFTDPDQALRFLQADDGHFASVNDQFGVNTFPTSQAVQALLRKWQPVARAAASACPDTGYRMVASDGGVFAFGSATFHGSTGNIRLRAPVVGMARTPGNKGYWLVASDGGVFAFGDAGFFGSAAPFPLQAPVVAIVATPTGQGYWLVASDGGVFAFGDAGFLGSLGSLRLNQPVVGAAATPSGDGYWMVGRDGGVFAFGDAPFFGGTLAAPANAVAIAGSPDGGGFWVVFADARVIAKGNADNYGGVTVRLNHPLVGVRPTFNGQGYWLAASDGGVFTPGNTLFFGSTGNIRLNAPIVGIG